MIRSIDPPLMSSRIGRIGLVGGVILLGMAGCASGPGESDLLPDEGPTTLQVYERHLAGEPLSGASSRYLAVIALPRA